MPLVTKEELFGSAWGMVADRREEIEKSSYGSLDRILGEEMEKRFRSARAVATQMAASESTARRWLDDFEARYVLEEGVKLFVAEDAERCIIARLKKEAERIEKRTAKEAI